MKGDVRSLVQEYMPNSAGVVTIKTPYDKLHVFEIQVFFPAGCSYAFKTTNAGVTGGVVFGPATNNVIGLKQPLILYCDPKYKRTDQLQFQRVSATKDNEGIIAIFSYIDQ